MSAIPKHKALEFLNLIQQSALQPFQEYANQKFQK